MPGRRRDLDLALALRCAKRGRKPKPRLAVTTSQLTSSEGRDSHEKKSPYSAPKQDLGNSREAAGPHCAWFVRDIFRPFGLLSCGGSFSPAIEPGKRSRRSRGARR